MKKLILISAFIAASFIFTTESITGIAIKNAECAWCSTYTCYGSCLGDSCVCVTPPGKVGGNCYGVEFAEEFKARGYKVQ